MTTGTAHRHGNRVHSHPYAETHRHFSLMLLPSKPVAHADNPDDPHHGHSHGLVDRSIVRSRAGIRAVSWSLAILTLTALAQAFIYSRTLSVALLADLIHNFGDALTAIPLGIAFFLRSAPRRIARNRSKPLGTGANWSATGALVTSGLRSSAPSEQLARRMRAKDELGFRLCVIPRWLSGCSLPRNHSARLAVVLTKKGGIDVDSLDHLDCRPRAGPARILRVPLGQRGI